MTFQINSFVRDEEFGLRRKTGAFIREDGIELLSYMIKDIIGI